MKQKNKTDVAISLLYFARPEEWKNDDVLLSEVFVEKFVLSAMIVSSLLLNARKNLSTMCCGGGGLGHSGYLCSKKRKNTANSKKSDLKLLLKYF